MRDEQFTAAARQPVPGFERLPAVARAAEKNFTRLGPAELPLERLGDVDLDVDEGPPPFVVGMKPLHEPRVAIGTGVGAARVAVQRIAAPSRTVEDRLAGHLADDDPVLRCHDVAAEIVSFEHALPESFAASLGVLILYLVCRIGGSLEA